MVDASISELAQATENASRPFVRRVVFALWLIGFWAVFVAAQDVIEKGGLLKKGQVLNYILRPTVEGAKLAQLFCLIAAISQANLRRQKLACLMGILAILTSLLIFRLNKRTQEVGLWPVDVTQVIIFFAFCTVYRFAGPRAKASDVEVPYQLKIADLFILVLAIALLFNVLRFRTNSLKQIFFADLELIGFYPRILLNVAITTIVHSIAGLCLIRWITPKKGTKRTLMKLAIAAIAGAIACAATQFAVFYFLYPMTRGQTNEQLAQFGNYLLIAFSFCGWLSLSTMLFRIYGVLPPGTPSRAR